MTLTLPKNYDTSLPQAWVNDTRDRNLPDPYGQVVWSYDVYKTFGGPHPVTAMGEWIVAAMQAPASGYGYTIGSVIASWLVLKHGKRFDYDEASDFANAVEAAMADGAWLAFRNGTTFQRSFTPEGRKDSE